MKKAVLIASVLMGSVSGNAQPYFLEGQDPKPADKAWEKVENLSDEFDGPSLDLSKWQSEPLDNGWGWEGRPPALFRAKNVVVKGGEMRVTVGKLDSVVRRNRRTYTHQGGLVIAIHPGQPGWYYECKMKANATEMSSTFWLMARDNCEKRQELDIQECVGRVSDKAEKWARGWDSIFHSNTIHHKTRCVPEKTQIQDAVKLKEANHDKFHVYAAWWKSPEEILFFLDGKYVYTIKPNIEWDMPAWLHMAIETYNWNPLPDDGGLVEKGTLAQRTTRYKWIRTWKLAEK